MIKQTQVKHELTRQIWIGNELFEAHLYQHKKNPYQWFFKIKHNHKFINELEQLERVSTTEYPTQFDISCAIRSYIAEHLKQFSHLKI